MTWTQFEVTGATGRPATLGIKVKLEVVECWVGGLVVVLDRDAFTAWLAAPSGSFHRDEVTFELAPVDSAAPSGLVVEFVGRLHRSVLGPDAVARLTAEVTRKYSPVTLGTASGAATTTSSAGGAS